MKKALLLALGIVFSVWSYGQSTRLVLLEEFTSSTCGPCAQANPGIISKLNANPDKFTAIFYHVNWPAPGNDPMYAQNPIDNSARVSYYSVNAVPHSILDGNYYSGSPSGWTMNTIDNRRQTPSPFEIQVQHQLNASQDTIFLTMVAKCTQSVSGNMTAHNVVIEKHIHFNSPPGTNGEKDFYNVMKKMLPSKDGTTLSSSFDPGDYVIIQTAWPLANVYDNNELAAIGFIQNKITKEVHQAVNSTVDPVTLPYDNDLQAMAVTHYSATNCSGKITPMVEIRNNGNDAITSFNLKYRMNDGTENSYAWTGNLTSLQKTLVTLPELTFTPQETNTLRVYTADPNNAPDDYAKNDTLENEIALAPESSYRLLLFVKTDNAPEETTWDIRDDAGAIIASGGPYTEAGHIYKDTIDLATSGCYSFTIYDAGGNGVCCTNGTGLYQLLDNEGTTLASGSVFGDQESSEFHYTPTGLEPTNMQGGVKVYPNPFSGRAQVVLPEDMKGKADIALYNAFGQVVLSFPMNLSGGTGNIVELNGNGLTPGIYILKVKNEGKTGTAKVSVTR